MRVGRVSTAVPRRWREVKRRPVRGNSPNDRILRGPDCHRPKRVCADSFPATAAATGSRNQPVPGMRLGRHAESIGPMGWSKPFPPQLRRLVLPPVGRPRSLGLASRIDDAILQPTPFVCRSGTKCEGPRNAFVLAWRRLSVRCVITSDKPGPGCRFTVGPEPGYRTRRKKHALPIVRDEFRPAIP
jgi:hypothetical protein